MSYHNHQGEPHTDRGSHCRWLVWVLGNHQLPLVVNASANIEEIIAKAPTFAACSALSVKNNCMADKGGDL